MQSLAPKGNGAIMMAKTQITLDTEMQRRARQRANELGVSLAEYFRRRVARDLARPENSRSRRPDFRSRNIGRFRYCHPKASRDRRGFSVLSPRTLDTAVSAAVT